MKKISVFFVAAILLASCSTESESSATNETVVTEQTEATGTASVQTIGSQEAKELLEQQSDVVVLDVRTPEEYASGHLKNAQLMNFNSPDFNEQLKTLDKDKTYLVHCAAGGRSGKATQVMEQMGFSKVYDATDGFSTLKSSGIPTE